ncbi:lipase [Oscillatoriales cyanobacterium USR001]|nr:lipase [Oscillatoriales cyanobacterium USR001]
MLYRFQINAQTKIGESIAIVGSTEELGMWNVKKCVHLKTNRDRYPLWSVDININDRRLGQTSESPKIEYKYLRLSLNNPLEWEAPYPNRSFPIEPNWHSSTLTIDDGYFGQIQTYPYGFLENPPPKELLPKGIQGLKIAVIGSSVALGCNAWLLRGWAWHLEQELHQKYGHQLVNLSEVGASVTSTIARFPLVIPPQAPDIVIIALSLGNEGLAHCAPFQRRAAQRRFESGLQQLIKMTQELGMRPILGGLYPNGDYKPEHNWLLRDTHHRMMNWGIPVLNWLDAVDDGNGRWKFGAEFNAAHPNTEGHRLMYEAIDLHIFQMTQDQLIQEKQTPKNNRELLIYSDNQGFQILSYIDEKSFRIINSSRYPYTIASYWEELQAAIQRKAGLIPGIYIAKNTKDGTLPFFSVRQDGTIETTVEISPDTDLEYSSALNFFSPKVSQILFYDGDLGILKENNEFIRVINESDHSYNIQPMWKEVRDALKEMPSGVYNDPRYPDVPFRTMMIGDRGLESRVKIPPKSSILFEYKCKLSEISRIAIVPLGDRCSARMLLYKMEYDGPAFPFDLTRTTNLGDVADIIESQFYDMWNPGLLYYDKQAGRIYHRKWSGLSFAHEVEDTDNPEKDMSPVYDRMRTRYTARSQRFWYTLQNADEFLFIRTGGTNRGYVIDLMNKLAAKCQGKPFRLMLISQQSGDEFAGIPNVLHYDLEFNPDRMYEDLGHWMYCTDVMREILESLGISSKNLFWCPPNPPKDS